MRSLQLSAPAPKEFGLIPQFRKIHKIKYVGKTSLSGLRTLPIPPRRISTPRRSTPSGREVRTTGSGNPLHPNARSDMRGKRFIK